MWITVAFDTSDDFGQPLYLLSYSDFDIEIKRGSDSEPHNLYIEVTKGNEKKAFETAYKFLSELAWLFNARVEVLGIGGSGSHKVPIGVMGKSFYRVLNAIYLDDYEQVAFSHEQKLALGLYREAISSNSKFYAFLCYFKIINLRYHSGTEQKSWINHGINKIRNNQKTLDGFISAGITDIGEHLYHSGRCAIAHASIQSGDAIADPDDYDDIFRISAELHLIQELAQILISEELNVPDRYEAIKIKMLRKFSIFLGEENVNKIMAQESLTISALPKVPKISLAVYKADKEFNSLRNLEFEIISVKEGRVILSNKNQDWPIIDEIILDFIKKDISFNVIQIDDKHAKANDNFILDYYYFLKAYFPNGRLEIWNAETKELLARLCPYIPVNIDLNETMENFQKVINYLEQKMNHE